MKRRAIVVGASSGLGREVAIRLLRDGWQVGVVSRRKAALESIAVPGTDKPHVLQIDVTSETAAGELRRLIMEMGGVDLYFHASGVGKQNAGLQDDIEMQTVNTNCMGFTRMVGEAFRWMAEHHGGHIAVISSIAGTKGLGLAPSYSATKAFQNTYVQALEQLSGNRHLNIRFTDIRPGFTDTDLIRDSHYPMTMGKDEVVDEIMAALAHGLHVRVIDWKWRLVVRLWKLMPNALWRKVRLVKS